MRPLALLAAVLSLATLAARADTPFNLPTETATLLPGPNLDIAQANCSLCHSADYILSQPRGLPDPKAFWSTEVTKMRHFYAAPIEDDAVPQIVEYLATTYAK
jgi:hypothetical protein